jgi:hypothetical protein
MTDKEAYEKLDAEYKLIAVNLAGMAAWFRSSADLAARATIKTDLPEVKDLIFMASRYLISMEAEKRR